MNRRELLAASAVAAAPAAAQSKKVRVLCWSERTEPTSVYPSGIDGTLADYLNRQPGIDARVAGLQDPHQGVSDEQLAQTDVLAWFGHQKHGEVKDERVDAIVRRMREHGLGFLALHSSHYSKVLKKALKTSGDLGGVGDGGQETVYVVNPAHPIAAGVSDFVLPQEEYYDEPFGIPEPDALVFFSVFSKPNKAGKTPRFRSGCCFEVGKGRLFYIRPGHETFPTWHHPQIQKIVLNACNWAARRTG